MTREQRMNWCLAQAQEIEATLSPQADPHEWDMPRLAAAFWRDMAAKLDATEQAA